MFKVGDCVIYPQHGAAVVEGLQDREVGGETREYLVLKLTYGDLTLMVPRDNCQEVGIREVCSSDDVEGVLEILRTGECSTQGNWSRRDKGISAGEKRMLQRSRQILVSELVLACTCDEHKATLMLDEALEVS